MKERTSSLRNKVEKNGQLSQWIARAKRILNLKKMDSDLPVNLGHQGKFKLRDNKFRKRRRNARQNTEHIFNKTIVENFPTQTKDMPIKVEAHRQQINRTRKEMPRDK